MHPYNGLGAAMAFCGDEGNPGDGDSRDVDARRRRDLIRSPMVVLIWGLPIAFAIFTKAAWDAHWFSFLGAGVSWAVVSVWIGTACFLNGRRCGRVHCRIDGVLLPLLAVAAILNLAGLVSFNWDTYANAFWIIIVASIIPECLGWRYPRRADPGPR